MRSVLEGKRVFQQKEFPKEVTFMRPRSRPLEGFLQKVVYGSIHYAGKECLACHLVGC